MNYNNDNNNNNQGVGRDIKKVAYLVVWPNRWWNTLAILIEILTKMLKEMSIQIYILKLINLVLIFCDTSQPVR